MEIFAYLSVLVSIVLGLGIAHLLTAVIRLINNRPRIVIYWPTLVWIVNLLLLMLLVWWSDFSLTGHRSGWTFAIFASTLAIPAILYVMSGLLVPPAAEDLRASYERNRVWFFSLMAAAILSSFVQSYLLDGHIAINVDAGLKAAIFCIAIVPIVAAGDRVQKVIAAVNILWLFCYVGFLFWGLPQ